MILTHCSVLTELVPFTDIDGIAYRVQAYAYECPPILVKGGNSGCDNQKTNHNGGYTSCANGKFDELLFLGRMILTGTTRKTHSLSTGRQGREGGVEHLGMPRLASTPKL